MPEFLKVSKLLQRNLSETFPAKPFHIGGHFMVSKRFPKGLKGFHF